MIIWGSAIALFTFPGVIVHEAAHQLFCYLFGIPVYKVCYFQGRFRGPSGYVMHGPAQQPWHNVLTAIGPFFVNSIVGAIIAFPAVIPIFAFHSATPLNAFLIWLGVSVAMHSFPSIGDASNILKTMKMPEVPLHTKLWAYPITGLIFAGAIGSVFWLDLGYGIFVTTFLPALLIHLLA